MAFNECRKSLNEIKAGMWIDYMMPFAVVHDEIDIVTLKHLRDPLMSLNVDVTSLKDIFDKRFQWAGIATTYDVEFDEWDSWTAVSAVPIYTYAGSPKELESKNEYYKLLEEIKLKKPEVIKQEIKEEPKSESITLEMKDGLLETIESLPDGETTVKVKMNSDKTITYNRKVNISTLSI